MSLPSTPRHYADFSRGLPEGEGLPTSISIASLNDHLL